MSTRLATTWLAAPWLDQMPVSPLRASLIRRAHADIGIEENGAAANRSPYLDQIATHYGSPLGSAWCALILGRWCDDVGALRPRTEVGAVRQWQRWAAGEGLWVPKTANATVGDIVVYDFKPDGLGDHIGVVARRTRHGVRTIEGNTSWAGSSREGVAVVMKPVTSRFVLGYIRVQAA